MHIVFSLLRLWHLCWRPFLLRWNCRKLEKLICR
uniref:Uncharacterized protein n=1 Tax=Arundo donax TaxID=35708 RepID=A0A0A8Y1R8_ARUDO